MPASLPSRWRSWRWASERAPPCSAWWTALLLRPLPFAQPERLVWVANHDVAAAFRDRPRRWATSCDLREQSRSFQALGGILCLLRGRRQPAQRTGRAGAVERRACLRQFLSGAGGQPQIGRLFTADECKWNGPKAVLLSYGFWERRFARESGNRRTQDAHHQ